MSYTVARLQEQLGVPLLQIQGRKAQPAEAGQALLRRSRHLVQEALDLEEFARGLEQGWEPEVRPVVDAAFPAAALMKTLRLFQPLSQGTRVQLSEVVLSGAEEALEQGQADLALAAHVSYSFLGEPLDTGVLVPLPLREGGTYTATLYLVYAESRHPGPGPAGSPSCCVGPWQPHNHRKGRRACTVALPGPPRLSSVTPRWPSPKLSGFEAH